ncbi:GNAT family N-acetyltransferase [Sphingomonas sp. SUN019]|uniref:GNAT family N-acetyltransferase n=1 Tax=Sphingomonas sp. SUN019 TaxID=2937788 RepID=UPI0021647062|nr:GNAT family N-acetyltransferase [Sphingomonas sp. SUN019]UVO52433.1 GNAT family N-acetyltransferase [Sphingomonas sp. SUN019]
MARRGACSAAARRVRHAAAAPDVRPRARCEDPGAPRMSTVLRMIELHTGSAADLGAVEAVMDVAFDPRFGEAWTRSQCLGILAMPGVWLTLARADGEVAGFALSRAILDEAELLLIATAPAFRRRGIGAALLRSVVSEARGRGVVKLHLEVRANNDAIALYIANGFAKVGERRGYYRGKTGQSYDAHSYAVALA